MGLKYRQFILIPNYTVKRNFERERPLNIGFSSDANMEKLQTVLRAFYGTNPTVKSAYLISIRFFGYSNSNFIVYSTTTTVSRKTKGVKIGLHRTIRNKETYLKFIIPFITEEIICAE